MTLSGYAAKISSPWAVSDRNLMQGDDHRGGGRMKPLSDSDKRYISEQISRYKTFTERQKQKRGFELTILAMSRTDALWRIASRAELFSDLPKFVHLTDDQWNRTIDFIEQFQANQ